MSVIRNTPTARKFAGAFGLVCTLCLGLGTYSLVNFRSLAESNGDVSESTFPSVVDLTNAQKGLDALRRYDLALSLCHTQECTASHLEGRQTALANFQDGLKRYEALIDSPEERQNYQVLTAKFAQYLEISNRNVSLRAAGKNGDASDLITSGSTVEIFNETQAATNADLNINVKQGMDSARSATSSSTRATWINLIVMLIIIALCAVIGLILNREIVPRIESLKIAVEAMAAKDLTTSVQVTGTDELGRLGEAFNTSMATVREVLVSVAQGAETLSAATTEISARAVQSAGNARSRVGQDQPDCGGGAGDDGDDRRDQPQRGERGGGQPRVGGDGRAGRSRDAGGGRRPWRRSPPPPKRFQTR